MMEKGLIIEKKEKRKMFFFIMRKAEKKYGQSTVRLAGEGWEQDWELLITTIMSAQSRDETTIPIAEKLFKKYETLEKLSNANYQDVMVIFSGLNYNRTKAKHVILCAQEMIERYDGQVPDSMDELVTLSGVGRKTAALVVAEIHSKDAICVDTHVHRIANVLGLVLTKTPSQTEQALMELAPKKYWSRINRLFVLWGKAIPGHDKERLLAGLE